MNKRIRKFENSALIRYSLIYTNLMMSATTSA